MTVLRLSPAGVEIRSRNNPLMGYPINCSSGVYGLWGAVRWIVEKNTAKSREPRLDPSGFSIHLFALYKN